MGMRADRMPEIQYCICNKLKFAGSEVSSQDSWGGKTPLEISQSQPLLRAGSGRTGCVQLGFEYLQGRRLYSLSEQSVLCLTTLTIRTFFRMLEWNLLYFSSRPLPHVLLLGTTDKSLAPSSLFPHQVFIQTVEVLLSFLFSKLQSQFSRPLLLWQMLQSLNHIHGPLLDSLQQGHVL